MYNTCCCNSSIKDSYDAMKNWNINPRTGQSMSLITDPRGNSIPVNVFMEVPKKLYFSDSDYYCCMNSRRVKYDNPANYQPRSAFFANSRFCCCTGNAEANYDIAMAKSANDYSIAQATNFGTPFSFWR